MRTNITIDSSLIETVQKYTGAKTKAKAAVMAMEDYLRWKRVEKIKSFKGKLKFRHDTDTARKKIR
jgi:Arc/MetJ family transcription regulator